MPLFQPTLNQTLNASPGSAPRMALSVLVAAATLVASAPARAGLTVLFPGLWGGEYGTPTRYGVGTNGLDLQPDSQGRAVLSQVKHGETRSFRLPTGPNNSIESGDENATSGLVKTTTSGQTVVAYSSLDRKDFDPSTFQYPVAAMTTPFQNHARASSQSELAMENDVPVTVGGVTYREFSFHKFSSNGGEATSAWLDAWTGNKNEQGSLKVALDGGLSINNACANNPACGYNIPPGITSVQVDRPSITIEATFAVYDLDWLLPCRDIDFCGYIDEVPAAVAMVQVEFDGDRTPFGFDQSWDLPYEVKQGHRYVSYGVLSVRAANGANIDFFNTMRLAGVDLSPGAVTSATVGDLAAFFGSGPAPVPEPGTAMLCLAALVGLGVRTRRRAAGQAVADDSAGVIARA